jgi:hypothetical protein
MTHAPQDKRQDKQGKRDKPTIQDAFTPLPPPRGGLTRLRAALDAQEAASARPVGFWVRLWVSAPPLAVAAAALVACGVGWLWLLGPQSSPFGGARMSGSSAGAPLTVILVSSGAAPAERGRGEVVLTVDPLWQASLPLPDKVLRPHQASHLLPVELGDDAVAFYWAERPLDGGEVTAPRAE